MNSQGTRIDKSNQPQRSVLTYVHTSCVMLGAGRGQRSAIDNQGLQILQLLCGEDRQVGEGPQRCVRNRRPHPQCAEKVDVPRVHLHGERRHLQAAAQRVSYIHGGEASCQNGNSTE